MPFRSRSHHYRNRYFSRIARVTDAYVPERADMSVQSVACSSQGFGVSATWGFVWRFGAVFRWELQGAVASVSLCGRPGSGAVPGGLPASRRVRRLIAGISAPVLRFRRSRCAVVGVTRYQWLLLVAAKVSACW